MAVDFSENFEGGANGANITNANSGFNQGVTGAGAGTFDNTVFAHGTQSGKLVASANTVFAQSVLGASTGTRTMRRYGRLSALPATGAFWVLSTVKLGAAASTGTLRVNSAGQIQMRDALTTVATTTNSLTINQWFRWEWQVNSGGTAQQLMFFVGGNFDSNTPDETISGSYSGGNFDTINTGIISSATATLWLDDALDDTALVTIGSAAPVVSSFTALHNVTIG